MSKPTVYIVQSEHWCVPGNPMSAHRTLEHAQAEAAVLTNLLRQWLGLSPSATPKTWRKRLNTARRQRARQMGCKVEELGDSNGDVWITQLELEG